MTKDGDYVVVLETSDMGLLAVVKSLLGGAEIPFQAKGEMVQDLMGAGRIGGVNLVTGPVELLVPEEQAADARALLADLQDPKDDEDDEDDDKAES